MIEPKTGATFVLLAAIGACFAACKGSAPAQAADVTSAECAANGERECKEASDCGTDLHCTGGRCYANQASCPCTEARDCGSSAHCARGMCHANQAGEPCGGTADCGPAAHCTLGVCYANASGSPCRESKDCGSGSSCVSGTCN